MSFPGFDQLFFLREARLAFTAKPAWRSTPAERIALTRAEQRPSAPLPFSRDLGRVPLDLVYGELEIRLVSRRAVDAFASAGLTGWMTYPVEVRDMDGAIVSGYAGLAVTGRCGALSPVASRRSRVLSPGGQPYRAYVGRTFDPSSWDGSDFVVPGPSYAIVVTDAVRRAAGQSHLRNMRFEPLSESELTTNAIEWLDDTEH